MQSLHDIQGWSRIVQSVDHTVMDEEAAIDIDQRVAIDPDVWVYGRQYHRFGNTIADPQIVGEGLGWIIRAKAEMDRCLQSAFFERAGDNRKDIGGTFIETEPNNDALQMRAKLCHGSEFVELGAVAGRETMIDDMEVRAFHFDVVLGSHPGKIDWQSGLLRHGCKSLRTWLDVLPAQRDFPVAQMI